VHEYDEVPDTELLEQANETLDEVESLHPLARVVRVLQSSSIESTTALVRSR
jgi:hypothetical protein